MLAALPGHSQSLGDARHRQMVDDQPSERPAHRRTRELRADRPLDSYPDATRENTPDTGSGARSHAKSWDATRRVREPSLITVSRATSSPPHCWHH